MLASAKPDSAKTSRAAASKVARRAWARPPPRVEVDVVTVPTLPRFRRYDGKDRSRSPALNLSGKRVASARRPRATVTHMPLYSLREASELLGVSTDTVRRWVDGGRLVAVPDDQGRRAIDGRVLAQFAVAVAGDADRPGSSSSMRNRFSGIVTKVVRGDVAAQVEVQSGPHRLVSLLTREAVDELDLQEGDRAVAIVKATNVAVELAT